MDLGQGFVTVHIVIETPKHGSKFTLDFDPIEEGMLGFYNESYGAMFSGTLVEINAALAGFLFDTTNPDDTEFVITFSVNDNGFTGQCQDNEVR